MTRHDLFPDWVKLAYTSFGRQKHAILPVTIDSSPVPGTEPDFRVRAGAAQSAGVCMTGYCNAAAHLFHSDATFDSYEVYHKSTLTSAPMLIYAAALGIPGVGTPANVEFSEIVASFKTPSPGGLKIYLMEGNVAVDLKIPFPAAPGSEGSFLESFILGADNFVMGRNDEFPLIGLFLTTKQNDFYRKRYKL